MNTYRVWMRDGSACLFNADTPEDAAEYAVEGALELAYEEGDHSAWTPVASVTVDKVELLNV